MSFLRVIDDAALEPVIVFGPFEQARESRNVVAALMESESTSVAYFPAETRTGEFQCLFASYADANAARDYFTVASLFDFLGPATTAGDYIVSAGRIVLSAGEPDPDLSIRFAATGTLPVTDNSEMWELRVSYREVPA